MPPPRPLRIEGSATLTTTASSVITKKPSIAAASAELGPRGTPAAPVRIRLVAAVVDMGCLPGAGGVSSSGGLAGRCLGSGDRGGGGAGRGGGGGGAPRGGGRGGGAGRRRGDGAGQRPVADVGAGGRDRDEGEQRDQPDGGHGDADEGGAGRAEGGVQGVAGEPGAGGDARADGDDRLDHVVGNRRASQQLRAAAQPVALPGAGLRVGGVGGGHGFTGSP